MGSLNILGICISAIIWVCFVIAGLSRSLLMKRDLTMVPKFLAKTDRSIIGLLSDTFLNVFLVLTLNLDAILLVLVFKLDAKFLILNQSAIVK